MIKFKYSDLSDGSTMAYKTFDRHYKSFEARRKQLEREEAIMLGLTAKMQELGEITYDEYNAVIAWMIHSDKSWMEILLEVFENHKFPSIYEKQGLTNQPQCVIIKVQKGKEMIQMLKMFIFDMDGTVADLYGVPNWLPMLRAFDPTPYRIAKPMWDMVELARLLRVAQAKGIEVRIVTWLSKESTPQYDADVRIAKREWLSTQDFPFDHFHGVRYGATKADSVRKYLNDGDTAILFDDNAKVREGWHLGEAIDPTACDLIEVLRQLVEG